MSTWAASILASVHKASMNMVNKVHAFKCLVIHSDGELLDHMATLFLTNHHIFCSSCTILHFHQKHTIVSMSLHPYLNLLIYFIKKVILTDEKRYLTMVLICIPLPHCFMCLLTICISSLKEYGSKPQFLIVFCREGDGGGLQLTCRNSLYIVILTP